MKVDPKLGGQWKEKEKESESRSKAWWPMEGEGEGSFLPLPTFPPSNFTWTFIFYPLTSRFYFTMVLGHYLHILFLFLSL